MAKVMMKVRYKGESRPLHFLHGAVYDVLGRETETHYRIVDEMGEDYIYSLDEFDIISGTILISLKNTDGESIGYMTVNSTRETKNGKGVIVTIGQCTCYKNSCDCVVELVLPKSIIENISELHGGLSHD